MKYSKYKPSPKSATQPATEAAIETSLMDAWTKPLSAISHIAERVIPVLESWMPKSSSDDHTVYSTLKNGVSSAVGHISNWFSTFQFKEMIHTFVKMIFNFVESLLRFGTTVQGQLSDLGQSMKVNMQQATQDFAKSASFFGIPTNLASSADLSSTTEHVHDASCSHMPK